MKETKLIRTNKVIKRQIGSQVLLFSSLSGYDGLCLYELNETATYMWNFLEAKPECSSTNLIDVIVDEFDITPEIASQDVSYFIVQMREIGAFF